MDKTQILADLTAILTQHVEEARARGNQGLALKWSRELKALTTEPLAGALVESGLEPVAFEGLAIYAAQKVRRLLNAYWGQGRADPYTLALLRNARTSGAIDSPMALATLNAKRATGLELAVRRHAADKTAQTQASSTRAALVALGAAMIRREKGLPVLEVDFNHRVIREVMT